MSFPESNEPQVTRPEAQPERGRKLPELGRLLDAAADMLQIPELGDVGKGTYTYERVRYAANKIRVEPLTVEVPSRYSAKDQRAILKTLIDAWPPNKQAHTFDPNVIPVIRARWLVAADELLAGPLYRE